MTITRRHSLQILLVAANSALPGCAWMRNWMGPRDPFAASAPCVLSPNATAVDVVNHLNANTAQIRGWRSEHVKIVGHGTAQTPVSVTATLVLESPRNFRLVAGSIAGEEVDFGSNAEQFWFWNRRSEEKYVFVAYHDQESASQNRRFPIPFQPEWIMETFGVIPIDASNVTARPGPVQPGQGGRPTIHLISEIESPRGGKFHKLIVVDICHGNVIEQALYDDQGQQIATASMSQFQHFKTAGPRSTSTVVLPRQYDLHWPKAGLGLTMVMSQIEINPQRISDRTWQLPTKEGYAVYDLSQR